MPAGEFQSWSVHVRFGRWIRALVDVGAPGFGKYRDYQRYVATAAQVLLEEILRAKTDALPPDLRARVLKAAGILDAENTTLLEHQPPEGSA